MPKGSTKHFFFLNKEQVYFTCIWSIFLKFFYFERSRQNFISPRPVVRKLWSLFSLWNIIIFWRNASEVIACPKFGHPAQRINWNNLSTGKIICNILWMDGQLWSYLTFIFLLNMPTASIISVFSSFRTKAGCPNLGHTTLCMFL